jgi:hypothetical protein
VVAAFAVKIEAALPADRARVIDAMLRAVAYRRVGNHPDFSARSHRNRQAIALADRASRIC